MPEVVECGKRMRHLLMCWCRPCLFQVLEVPGKPASDPCASFGARALEHPPVFWHSRAGHGWPGVYPLCSAQMGPAVVAEIWIVLVVPEGIRWPFSAFVAFIFAFIYPFSRFTYSLYILYILSLICHTALGWGFLSSLLLDDFVILFYFFISFSFSRHDFSI